MQKMSTAAAAAAVAAALLAPDHGPSYPHI